MTPVRHNPRGWRWRLVLWLTGGVVEAIPMLPHRTVYSTETLRIRLGRPGYLNTAEVKPDDQTR